jgi:hypothetical protein
MPETIPSFRSSNPGLPRYPNTVSAQPTTQGRPASLPSDHFERRSQGDRTVNPEPRWSLVSTLLVVIGLLIGTGIALGGAYVAIGIGIGYLTVALTSFVWQDLVRIWRADS